MVLIRTNTRTCTANVLGPIIVRLMLLKQVWTRERMGGHGVDCEVVLVLLMVSTRCITTLSCPDGTAVVESDLGWPTTRTIRLSGAV